MTFFDRTDWQNWLPGCGCEPINARVVQFEISGGETRFGLQCLHCERVNGGKPVAGANLTAEERAEAIKNKLNLAESRQAAEAARHDRMEQRAEERAKETAEWWTTYDAYLRSPEWRNRRVKVLERDQYLCQACRDRRAVQVHHLTYAHLFNEPIFELVAICVTCHELITAIDRCTIPNDAPLYREARS